MAVYYVDDGGSSTSPYDTWAKAATSIVELDAAVALASNDIVYFGHDMAQTATGAAISIVSAAVMPPCIFISATQGSDPPTYQASTTPQINNVGGAYDVTLSPDYSLSMYGISITAGDEIRSGPGNNDICTYENCRFAIGANSSIILNNGFNGHTEIKNLTVDLTSDGTTNRTQYVFASSGTGNKIEIYGLSFINPGYRTGAIFNTNSGEEVIVSGADFSGFPSSCEIANADTGASVSFSHCLTGATWTPVLSAARTGKFYEFINCGPEDNPTYYYRITKSGSFLSSSAIYRTGGAEIETVPMSFLVTTTAFCSEAGPMSGPWIYGEVTAGSKTFDVYITNDTADFTDAEVWLTVEYLGTADEAQSTTASDHRTITTSAVAQTDDAASTWNGTGPSFTYKQKLSVTATVGEAGMYRARVCVGVASIASSRYFYIDPKVTVS